MNSKQLVILSELRKGIKAKVIRIDEDNPYLRRKLLDMGFSKNLIVKIKNVAPLGDPIDIELRGYELCVRKAEVAGILVEVL